MMYEVGMFLLTLGTNPWAIAAAIIVATFVLEDVAIIAAAMLAEHQMITPFGALSALIAGIFVGDLTLYGLGAYARTHDWAHRVLGDRRIAKGRQWLKRRYVPALIGARFMPGFRLPTYASSGFLHLPFWPFAGVAAGAGLLWTSAIFALVLFFGSIIVEQLGAWRWALAAVLLGFILFGPMIAERLVPMNGEKGHG